MDISDSDDQMKVTDEVLRTLVQLREQPVILGRTSMTMMEEFRDFPWTQGIMIAVGTLENVLTDYLEKELKIGERVIKGWKTTQQLHWRAMLSLAVYEANTKEDNRAKVDTYLREYNDAIRELVEAVGSDTLGDSIVESTRKLGGDGKGKQKRKIPKKPRKVSRTKGTKGGKKGTTTHRRGRPREISDGTRKTKRLITKRKVKVIKESRRKRKLRTKLSSSREQSKLSPKRSTETLNTSSPDRHRTRSHSRSRRSRRRWRDRTRERSRRRRSRSRSSSQRTSNKYGSKRKFRSH